MILTQEMVDELNSKIKIADAMDINIGERLKNSSKEDQKKAVEVTTTMFKLIKSGDLEGAKRFLMHAKNECS